MMPPRVFATLQSDSAVVSDPGVFDAPWLLPVGAVAAFLAVVAMIWVAMTPSRARSQLRSSEGQRFVASGGLLTRVAERARWSAEKVLGWAGRHAALSQSLDVARVRLTAGEFVILTISAGLLGAALGALLFGIPGAVILGIMVAALPRLAVFLVQQKRRSDFAEQLDGTLQLLAGSLRAGYGLLQSINAVAAEAPAPASEEYGRIMVETRLGRDLVESFNALADRMDSEDSRWIAGAIDIQRSVGGDLVQILDNVSQTIRERNQIRRQVASLSAEGRFSAYVMIALPFGLAGLVLMTAPDYLSPLVDTPVGLVSLGVGAFLLVVGVVWIRRLVRLWF